MNRRQFFKTLAATVAAGTAVVVAPSVLTKPKGVVRGDRARYIYFAGQWYVHDGVNYYEHENSNPKTC